MQMMKKKLIKITTTQKCCEKCNNLIRGTFNLTKRLKFIYSEKFLDTCLTCNKQIKKIIKNAFKVK